MTQATQTTLGEIKLAGDLTGDASAPSLSSTGVTAGVYTFPTITIDGKGRISSAVSGSSSDLTQIIPGASKTTKGILKVGNNIEVNEVITQGYALINFGGTIVGSDNCGLDYDPDRPYSFLLTSSGQNSKTISIVTEVSGSTYQQICDNINSQLTWTAASIVGGNIRFVPDGTGAGSFVAISSDKAFKYMAGYVGPITSAYGMDANTIYLKEASNSEFGVLKVGYGLSVVDGVVSFNTSSMHHADENSLGVVQVGAGLNVTSGIISLDDSSVNVPIASDTVVGGVKIGDGLTFNPSDGTVSVDIPVCSQTVMGVAKIGNNISVTEGVISIPQASNSVKGIVSVGNGLKIENGALEIDSSFLATSTQWGLVKVGTGLIATNGVLSVDTNNIPSASVSTKGAVKIGTNIGINSGVISVATATSSVLGLVKINTSSGLSIDANGTLSVDTSTIGLATASTFGLVKTGSGIISDSGVLSVDTSSLPVATSTTLGVVQVGANLSVSNGALYANVATASTLGVIKTGAGLNNTSGVLNADISTMPNASLSTAGKVKIGANITAVDGTISVPIASTSVAGIARIGTVGLNIDPNGAISVKPAGINTSGVVKLPTDGSITATSGVLKLGEGIVLKNNGNVSYISAPFFSIPADPVDMAPKSLPTSTCTVDLSKSNAITMILAPFTGPYYPAGSQLPLFTNIKNGWTGKFIFDATSWGTSATTKNVYNYGTYNNGTESYNVMFREMNVTTSVGNEVPIFPTGCNFTIFDVIIIDNIICCTRSFKL